MKRGSVAIFRETNSPAAKARPCIIVQSDVTLEASTKVIAVPLSSTIRNVPVARPLIAPDGQNGLTMLCEAEVDWVFSFNRERLGHVIGQVDASAMQQIDMALRRWLDL